MPQTIDYKVNVDLNEAMSTLQMVDMQMSQLGNYGGGRGGFAPMQGQISHTERAFGDLSFSAGQFVQRFQMPLGTIQTHTPEVLSTMPNINLATAATAVWNPGGLSVPQGVARFDFERYAQEQFAVQGGRAIAGGIWGAARETMSIGAGAIGAAVGSAVLPGVGTLAGGIGGYMLSSTLLEPVTGMLQDRAIMEDLVRSSSKLSAEQSRVVAADITKMHLSDPLMSSKDMMQVAGFGARFGLMGDPASSSSEYLKNFRKLTEDAKSVASALGTSLQEGMATMAQLKGAGFGVGQIGGVVDQLSGIAGGDPSKIRGLIGTGMMGASAFHGTGMARTGGFWQAIGTAGAVGSAFEAGDVSREMWHQAGGKSGVTRLMLGSNLQFQQSGMGIAMQAGLWQGGTGMANFAGGDVMDLMAGGLGGMGSGDFLAFNRNRAEALGGMSESSRRRMEAQAQMQIAGMMAESLGGDVGDALFMMAQGRGMSVPQAQTWASAIQAQAQARGAGGTGGSARSRMRASLVAATERRNQESGVDAVLGRFRDRIDSYYDETFVQPVTAVQNIVEGKLKRYAEHNLPPVASPDLVMASIDGELKKVAANTSGMDISDYKWAPDFAAMASGAGLQKFSEAGKGRIKVADDVYYASTDVYGVIEQAQSAADKAWGTSADQIRNGRAGDTSRIYRDLAKASMSSSASRQRIRDAYAEGGVNAALRSIGVSDLSNASQLGAGVAVLGDFGIKSTKDDLTIGMHQQMGVAAHTGEEATKLELREILGFGDRTWWDRFKDSFAAKQTRNASAMRTVGGVAAEITGSAAANRVGVASLLSHNNMARGIAAVGGGLTLLNDVVSSVISSTGEDLEQAAGYEKYSPGVAKYLKETGDVTADETAEAKRRIIERQRAGGVEYTDASGAAAVLDSKALEAEAFKVSRENAMMGLKRSLAGDKSADKMLDRLDAQQDVEVKQMLEKTASHVEAHGGPGKKVTKKSQTVVPIAMGIDATQRDLYNAVSSLYRSVTALEKRVDAGGKPAAPPAE